MLSISRTLPEDQSASLAYGADLILDLIAGDDDSRVRYVHLAIDFGDGSATVSLDSTTGSISFIGRHTYAPGTYSVTLTLSNRVAPRAQTLVSTLEVTVTANEEAPEGRVIYGPILPRDNGFPNRADWLFNVGKDDRVVESSVKMLLITARGERVQEREYGISARSMLFDLNTPDLEDQIRTDIQSACQRWVPLAELLNLNTQREGRTVKVIAAFRSRLSDRTFTIQLLIGQ